MPILAQSDIKPNSNVFTILCNGIISIIESLEITMNVETKYMETQY